LVWGLVGGWREPVWESLQSKTNWDSYCILL
jgi:hypothetical protein